MWANWGSAPPPARCARAWIVRRTARCSTPWWPTKPGEPQTIPGAVAIYERDAGVAWKHGDNVRRARELVVGYLTQPGNYEYGFDWIFHQDGTLEMRVALTGIMAVQSRGRWRARSPRPHGREEYRRRAPPALLQLPAGYGRGRHRQPRAGDEQRVHAARARKIRRTTRFIMQETPLRTERQAERNMNLESSRRWIVRERRRPAPATR